MFGTEVDAWRAFDLMAKTSSFFLKIKAGIVASGDSFQVEKSDWADECVFRTLGHRFRLKHVINPLFPNGDIGANSTLIHLEEWSEDSKSWAAVARTLSLDEFGLLGLFEGVSKEPRSLSYSGTLLTEVSRFRESEMPKYAKMLIAVLLSTKPLGDA